MSHCVKLKRRSDGERAVGDGTLEILNPRSQRSEKVDAAHILPPSSALKGPRGSLLYVYPISPKPLQDTLGVFGISCGV
ncbi:MAG: hypothetical protein QXR18_09195, partial [Pyrobaculum sp.]